MLFLTIHFQKNVIDQPGIVPFSLLAFGVSQDRPVLPVSRLGTHGQLFPPHNAERAGQMVAPSSPPAL